MKIFLRRLRTAYTALHFQSFYFKEETVWIAYLSTQSICNYLAKHVAFVVNVWNQALYADVCRN